MPSRLPTLRRYTIIDPAVVSDAPLSERPHHWSLGYDRRVKGTLVGYSAAKGYLGKAPSQFEIIAELMESRGYQTTPTGKYGSVVGMSHQPEIIDIAFFRVPDDVALMTADKIEKWIDADPLDYLVDIVRMYRGC